VIGGSERVRNTALGEYRDRMSDTVQRDANTWPVPGVHKVLKKSRIHLKIIDA